MQANVIFWGCTAYTDGKDTETVSGLVRNNMEENGRGDRGLRFSR